MELRDYVRILKKYWVVLVTMALFGGAAGFVASSMQSPTYEASTRVFVSAQPAETAAELAQASNYTSARVGSYAALADSQRVLDEVIASLGLAEGYWSLAERVSASIVPETTVIEITAESDTPDGAVAIADATAASLTAAIEAIESPAGQDSPVQLAVVQQARAPSSPTHPIPTIYVALGALLGLALAAGLAQLRSALDTRIHGESDVRAATDAPILGAIAFNPKAKQRPLVVHADPLSAGAESYRALRTSLQFVEVDGRSRTFVVTAPTAGVGKSTTTANLALALADAGQRVILVDADLRQPKLAEYMGLDPSVGLTDVLIGRAELGDVVQPWGTTSLSVLPAGQIPPNPSELLGSKVMAALIATLGAQFDWVLFDSPPLLPVTDAAVLSEHVNAVVMVVSAGRTTKHQLEMAAQRLRMVDTQVVGVVLTMTPTRGADAYRLRGKRVAPAARAPRTPATS